MLAIVDREEGARENLLAIGVELVPMVRISELLDKSARSFVISTPVFSDIRDELGKKLTNAIQRGVEVIVITAPFQRVNEDVRVIRNDNLIATDVISDSQSALLASLDLSACGFSDNPGLSQHLQRFLDILINSSQGHKEG